MGCGAGRYARLRDGDTSRRHCETSRPRSLSMQQLVDFHRDIEQDLQYYCGCHSLGPQFQHLCLQAPCLWDHHGVLCALAPPQGPGMNQLDPLVANMHVVVARYVKPRTRGCKCGLAGMLNPGMPVPPDVFVSHCWDEAFADFVTTLRNAIQGSGARIWVCSFIIDQNTDITSQLGRKLEESPFAVALRTAGQVVMCVDEKMETLTRVWCVYEYYLAQTLGKPLLIWAPEMTDDFWGRMEAQTRSLSVADCSASNPADKTKILRAISGREAEIDSMVLSLVVDKRRTVQETWRVAQASARISVSSTDSDTAARTQELEERLSESLSLMSTVIAAQWSGTRMSPAMCKRIEARIRQLEQVLPERGVSLSVAQCLPKLQEESPSFTLAPTCREPTASIRKLHELPDIFTHSSTIAWTIYLCVVKDASMLQLRASCKPCAECIDKNMPMHIYAVIVLASDRRPKSLRVVEKLRRFFDAYMSKDILLYQACATQWWPQPRTRFLQSASMLVYDASDDSGQICAAIYKSTVEWATAHARDWGIKAVSALEHQSGESHGWARLEDAVFAMDRFFGVLHPITKITHYLNRYYVTLNSLPPVRKRAVDEFLGQVDSRTCVPHWQLSDLYDGPVDEQVQRLQLLARGKQLSEELGRPDFLGADFLDLCARHAAEMPDTGGPSAPNSNERFTLVFQDHFYEMSKGGALFEQSSHLAGLAIQNGEVIDMGTSEGSRRLIEVVADACEMQRREPIKDVPRPLPSGSLGRFAEVLGNEDIAKILLGMPQELLFEVILLANRLDIKWLLDATCALIAAQVQGKSTEEIRRQFNIVNDFTPEEEAQVREENRWCEDA